MARKQSADITKAVEPAGIRVSLVVSVKAADAQEAEQKVFDTLYPLPWVQRVRSEALDKSK